MVPTNYLAVFVCLVEAIILGSVWYGPLFGTQWMKLMGWGPEVMEKMKKEGQAKMMQSYGIMAVGSLIMAYVLSHAVVFASNYMQVSGIVGGLETGFASWIGFIAPATMGGVLWEGKPWKWWFILAGYYLVNLLLMGLILGAWM